MDNIENMDVDPISYFAPHNLLPELLRYICKYLGRCDLHQLRLACKEWNTIAYLELMKKSILIISRYNVANLWDIFHRDDNVSRRFSYHGVEIHEIHNGDDVQPLLRLLGPKIHKVCLFKSPIFKVLSDCLPRLEELIIKHIHIIRRENLAEFQLSKLKKFKSLDVKCPFVSTDISNSIMLKLTVDQSIKMEKLCIDIQREQHEILIDVLQFHSKSLKHLEISSVENCPEINLIWMHTFTMLNNLEFLKITGAASKTWLMNIMKALPKETPLKYICLDSTSSLELYKLVMNKWSGSLESLELIDCETVENEHARDLINIRNNLRSLIIKDSDEISPDGLIRGIASKKNYILKTFAYNNPRHCDYHILKMQILVQRFPCLTNLSFENCEVYVNNLVLSCIFRFLLHLQHLTLDGCSQITDAGLLGFSPDPAPITNLKGLKSLNLRLGSQITDNAITKCFKFIELRKLECNFFHQISPQGVKELVKNCPALEEISFSGCRLIDDDSVLYIAQGLPRLEKLNVSFCRSLTSKSVDYIMNFCKSLKELSMRQRSFQSNREILKKLEQYGIPGVHYCC